MDKKQAISEIRSLMAANNLDACIIPSTDPHMGEYIPSRWAAREWISGFTGSAGTVVITMDFAGLWTDSRYFLQAEEELKTCGMQLVKLNIPHTPEHLSWLAEKLPEGSTVAIDGQVTSVSMIRLMESIFSTRQIKIETGIDLPGMVWANREDLPAGQVFEHNIEYAGESRQAKIKRVRSIMAGQGADFLVVCSLDEVAWLFNLRGKDIPYNPVFVSYALISASDAILFANPEKFPCQLMNDLNSQGISIMDYWDIRLVLSSLGDNAVLMLDPGRTNNSLYKSLPHTCRIMECLSPVVKMKAIKNDIEIEGFRKVMIKDGIAWVRFLHWLETNIGKEKISELSAADKLASFRAMQDNYQGPSFHPISSYGAHGAVVHYSVSQSTDIELKPDGIYLCDTGGHYLDGTTDTTRTVCLGRAREGQKKDFTLALKGTIGLSMLRFPKGTRGYQVDILARKALWDHGLNYGHGTGHGVGFFLNVHEGPQSIGTGASGNMDISLEPGMVTTIEPAIYREGEYGMRTENVTLVVKDIENENGAFYKFETLTLAPIDKNLIETELLSPGEKKWLNEYHLEVFRKLGPGLEEDELTWLEEKTRAL